MANSELGQGQHKMISEQCVPPKKGNAQRIMRVSKGNRSQLDELPLAKYVPTEHQNK